MFVCIYLKAYMHYLLHVIHIHILKLKWKESALHFSSSIITLLFNSQSRKPTRITASFFGNQLNRDSFLSFNIITKCYPLVIQMMNKSKTFFRSPAGRRKRKNRSGAMVDAETEIVGQWSSSVTHICGATPSFGQSPPGAKRISARNGTNSPLLPSEHCVFYLISTRMNSTGWSWIIAKLWTRRNICQPEEKKFENKQTLVVVLRSLRFLRKKREKLKQVSITEFDQFSITYFLLSSFLINLRRNCQMRDINFFFFF